MQTCKTCKCRPVPPGVMKTPPPRQFDPDCPIHSAECGHCRGQGYVKPSVCSVCHGLGRVLAKSLNTPTEQAE